MLHSTNKPALEFAVKALQNSRESSPAVPGSLRVSPDPHSGAIPQGMARATPPVIHPTQISHLMKCSAGAGMGQRGAGRGWGDLPSSGISVDIPLPELLVLWQGQALSSTALNGRMGPCLSQEGTGSAGSAAGGVGLPSRSPRAQCDGQGCVEGCITACPCDSSAAM